MASIESLKQQLSDLLILHQGDIQITNYPSLVSDANGLGLNLGQLSQLIQKLYSEINWKPFDLINSKLELVFRKGFLSIHDFEEIVIVVGDLIDRNNLEQYVTAQLSKRGFKTREINHATFLSIQNKWMTDLVWEEYKESLIEVEWLGQMANSLAKLGEISFQNKDDAKYFLRTGNYLPGLVTSLTKSASKADEFARIIEDEFDSEKRYFQIIYKLNPNLPYRFKDELYTNVSVLIQKACETSQGYYALMESYITGLLQIWIRASDPVLAMSLTEQYNEYNFLTFLYSTHASLPFYIENKRFATPNELIEWVISDFSIWTDIAHAIESQNLQKWFAAINHTDWNDQLEAGKSFIIQTGYYTESEARLGLVQALIRIIDPFSEKPKITIDQQNVNLLSINSGVRYNHTLKINLQNQGYLKVKVFFKFLQQGIAVSEKTYELNSWERAVSKDINVSVETLQLQKGHQYDLELIISSVYQDIVVPIKLKAVFPRKQFIAKIATYGVLTACYFGGFRFLLGLFLDDHDWLVGQQNLLSGSSIGSAPMSSFIVFGLFVFGALYSFKLVKKIEKI